MNSAEHQMMANSIRALSMDCVQKAKSGHPGAPMGMADMATVLWRKFLRVNPNNPKWLNRDRFVLSNGHASALQYSLLYLAGFDLSLEDLKAFRQLHSKTAGHPEVHETVGVETTTGPLGQGIANAVGFALSEACLAARFNREDLAIVNHYTYCFVGDGCLMEGVSHEACSLAGTLGLGKLIVFYDSNGISIDGEIAPWYSENVAERFLSYGWQVIDNIDGHDEEALQEALSKAREEQDKPSLIICRTQIGFGSPNLAGSEKSHGAPLGEAEILATKKVLNLPLEPFSLPDGVLELSSLREKGAAFEADWWAVFEAYKKRFPEEALEFMRVMQGDLPLDLDDVVHKALLLLQEKGEKIATRKASERALDVLGEKLPELLGGSADLTGSNLTFHKNSKNILPHHFDGNYLSYGVREFAMSAMMNGMALHGGLRPYGGTFLVFSDYMRNGIRMSALMQLPVVYVLTHDSIGLGEDGPTHQPVEHISSLRLIPNLHTWRPCDSVETLVAWHSAIKQKTTPSALALSRQNLPVIARDEAQITSIYRGAYVLSDQKEAQLILIATGSEVELALEAQKILQSEGILVRVVSAPCLEIFAEQDALYQEEVLPKNTPKLAIEAGSGALWKGIVGDRGDVIALDSFGASAPAAALFELYGFTSGKIVEKAKELLS